jgi:hypothetical protein
MSNSKMNRAKFREMVKAAKAGRTPGMKQPHARHEGMKQQRWIFTAAELAIGGEGCKADDEFVVHLPENNNVEDVGVDLGIIICRNGNATNRWEDGTFGVQAELAQLAEEVESYYQQDTDHIADNWRDVEVRPDGTLYRVVPPRGTTVTEEKHGFLFRGKWTTDGSYIYRDGKPVMEVKTLDHLAEVAKMGNSVLAFCQEARRLDVRHFGPEKPAQLFLTVNCNELSATGDTVATVEVQRGSSTARFHLRLNADDRGNVSATLTAQAKSRDISKTQPGHYVDWYEI